MVESKADLKKILYIPLDERPCNAKYPVYHANDEIDIVVPDEDCLPQKKKPSDMDKLWKFVFDNAEGCNGIIFAAETLIYGGLLPSRIYHESLEVLKKRVGNIKNLKEKYPDIKIFASSLIMRTPSYNSSEEEPDYYEEYGEDIFNFGRLLDKKNRLLLEDDEAVQLKELNKRLPKEVINDYTNRRKLNLEVTKEIITLVKQNVIDFLVIPQDDSHPFGFTAIDQAEIRDVIEENHLENRVYTYPGADESGCTLLSRMYNQLKGKMPLVYPCYSSVLGQAMIPKYEDRPFGESVKAHILAQGALVADTPSQADYILMINISGKVMHEAWEQDKRDISYETYRNISEFIEKMKFYIRSGHKCVVCDVAFSNGADKVLIRRLAEEKLFDKIYGYAGWNTACNSLGTALNMAFLSDKITEITQKNIAYRLIEDYGFQSIVKEKTIKIYLDQIGASYYNFNSKDELIHSYIKNELAEIWANTLQQSFNFDIKIKNVSMPWKRMFEVDFEIEII